MNQKSMWKAVLAMSVALAFVLPGSAAFANVGTIGVTSNGKNTVDVNNNVGGTIMSDTLREDTILTEKIVVPAVLLSRGTVYVDDNAPPEWYDPTHVHTITQGVTAAIAGDTVYVYNGTYYDHVIVSKQLTLVGESKDNVIVNGSGTGNVFYITTPITKVNISTFTITNGQYGIQIKTSSYNSITNCDVYNNVNYGIYLSSSNNNNNITNCNAHNNNNYGIYLASSSNNNITNCNAYNNSYGILLSSSKNNNITNCNMYNNSQYGIFIQYSSNNKLRGNIIYDNIAPFYVSGSMLAHFTQDVDPSNTVNGKPIYYLVNAKNITLDETDNVGYLGLVSCTNITAKNGDVNGILMAYTTKSTISNASSHNSGAGIYLYASSNNNITNCDVYKNKAYGIYIYTSSNNNITNCNAYNNSYGILLQSSSNNNVITNCNAYNNMYGIYLDDSSTNNITNCNAYNNSQYGIYLKVEDDYLTDSSNNNDITNCDAYNNKYGISLENSPNNKLRGNTIYNNVFNFGVVGSTLAHFTQDIDPSNMVNGKSIYYLTGQSNITLDETNNFGYLGLVSCKNITAKNADVNGVLVIATTYSTILNVSSHNSANGIYLWMGSNNNITNCNAYNNSQYGIYIQSSSTNNIMNCNAYNNSQYGIYTKSSSNNHITNCDVYNNKNYGISLASSSNNNNITNCNVYNTITYYGIYLYSSSNNVITNCNAYNNKQYGIYLASSSNNNIITNCNAYNNTNGIYLNQVSNNKLRGNIIYNNVFNFGVVGTTLAHFTQDIDPSNTVNGKHIYYLVNAKNITMDETDNVGYLGLVSCTNITAKNGDVNGILVIATTYSTILNVSSHNSANGYGIYLWMGSNNNITNCDAYNNSQHGIYIQSSSNNVITNCDAYSNTLHGILLHTSSNNNDIINCNAYNNGQNGIYLYTSSNNNDIINCNAYNNMFGIYLYTSSNNVITNCNAYNNSQYGIFIQYLSNNNVITNCNAYNNKYGIYVLSASNNVITNCDAYKNTNGIYLASSSNNNLIHHNNFVNNVVNAYDACSNQWDNGSKGNYWSDYTGVDANGDGIGDTPYNISGKTPPNNDRYPLMNPLDVIPPVITAVQATPALQNITTPVNITCTVTDNWNLVDTVKINITGPGGFTLEATMNEGSYYYEDTYTTVGIYFYYIRATDTSGNVAVSDTYSFVIRTELEAPISAVNPLPTWKKVVPFAVTATAYDNTGVANVTLWSRYSTNGISWTANTSYGTDFAAPWSWLFTGVDGYYQFYSIAVDTQSNVEAPPSSADASTGIDTTKPVTTSILNGTIGENGWYVSPVTVILSATDTLSGIESTWCQKDSGYWTIYTVPFTVSGDGVHTVQYYSFDHAGNQEAWKSVSLKIDTTAPTTTHTLQGLLGSQGWYVTNVTVTLSANDVSSGVNHTKYNLNNGSWIVYTGSFVVTTVGNYTLQYYSVDLAGNTEATKQVAFRIQRDVTPPVTTSEFDGILGENNWFIGTVTVMLSAVDDSAGVASMKYKLDAGAWTTYTGAFLVTEDAVHTLYYYSVDKVGNREENKSATLKIDQTAPIIDLAVEKTGLNKWLLTATVSDETSGVAKVEFYVDGEFVGEDVEAPYELEYSGTGDTAQAIVYDNAGNSATSAEVKDQAAPDSQSQSSMLTLVSVSKDTIQGQSSSSTLVSVSQSVPQGQSQSSSSILQRLFNLR